MKTEEMGECTEEICIARVTELSDEHKQVNTEVNKHCNRILAADAADAAVSLANTGNMEEARSCLERKLLAHSKKVHLQTMISVKDYYNNWKHLNQD